ncbi:MAG TPA: hypothetical protein VK932_24510 [Kofleriaceae bacterium]|nr:hypothetical protein [Kofleriaceae bacterium]
MARPAFGLVLVGWLCAAGAAFLALFDLAATDDYAGWVPAIVALQVPAIVALWPVRREKLPAGLRLALALPAALVAGFAVFLLTMPLLMTRLPDLLAFLPLGFGLAAVVVAAVTFGRILEREPHPRGARRVLVVVAVLGAAGAGMTTLWLGPVPEPEWLVVAVPVAWALPLYLLATLQPRPEPPIPRAAVARAERPGD